MNENEQPWTKLANPQFWVPAGVMVGILTLVVACLSFALTNPTGWGKVTDWATLMAATIWAPFGTSSGVPGWAWAIIAVLFLVSLSGNGVYLAGRFRSLKTGGLKKADLFNVEVRYKPAATPEAISYRTIRYFCKKPQCRMELSVEPVDLYSWLHYCAGCGSKYPAVPDSWRETVKFIRAEVERGVAHPWVA